MSGALPSSAPSGGSYAPCVYCVSLRAELGTFSWLLEPMLERADFDVERADYAGGRTHATYLCTMARR